jgi:L-aminoadipate-semialdehyde dehydrogenase
LQGTWDEQIQQAISTLVTREKTSIFNVILTAFAILLHKYTGEEDIAIGSQSDVDSAVLRFKLSDDDSWHKCLKIVMQTEDEAKRDAVGFQALLQHLFPNATPDQQLPALFKVRFLEASAGELHLESPHPNLPHLYSDLTLFVSGQTQIRGVPAVKVSVDCLYNSLLFSSSRILDMFDAMGMILLEASKHLDKEIGRMNIVTHRARAVIPDPNAVLDWHGWQGAITDIFHANATKLPDRLAVSESTVSGKRTFTYKQLDEASNTLAHYLLSKGIEPGDVITTYAYRGVELVVAVMGILKSGAVFNVIDPQYPPERQIIYLGVAQPRALIVCKRAVEGGLQGLDKTVQSFIDQNLALKVAVPGLYVEDDGTLQGGSNQDFSNTSFPGIELGPDSIGTLSFTSGSTGIPKGVRGRHFSLTHFYPWMRQRFQLSESDRFTMLSGIAHDPIQRDIFTPLFLGASLHVPTADDIATPGALATWMAGNAITITHLTPAMGQLLSAGATTLIPSLRNSFFVGDVLTKRDVVRLQSLAENVAIINMYGTTETQRAVSYLKIPSRAEKPNWMSDKKDIMPAGLGMKDVQLLVINNKGLLCGIGEV